MESTKLKNFIIVLLLLLNLVFLFFVGHQERQSRQYEASTRENTTKILKNNGIDLLEDIIPWEDDLPPLKVTRDREREAQLAQELLGEVQAPRDTGFVLYEGARGKLHISRSGEFTLTLNEPEPAGDNWQESALTLLRGLDFQGQVIHAELLGNGGKRATIWQVLDGHPVFNCQVEANWDANGLLELEGRRLNGKAEEDAAGGSRLEVTTLIIRFLDGLRERDTTCSEIRSITPGYLYAAGLTPYATLTPAWYLETDNGDYLLDCTSGKLSLLQEN